MIKLMWEWVKKNKLASVLLLLVVLYVGKNLLFAFSGVSNLSESAPQVSFGKSTMGSLGSLNISDRGVSLPPSGAAPVESEIRMVVEESSVSLVVADVSESVDRVVQLAQEAGGFMVNRSLTSPEEAPYAVVSVRVPSEQFEATLGQLHELAVKVSSENIRGTDVTAEYEDLEAKLATYYQTKTKFEEILSRADEVKDILNVQREIINIQSQIDNLKGRQKYLEQTAKLALITAHLSTDEWSLPYTPAQPFRAGVIFKEAIRSLIITLRGLAEKAIWLLVYSVVWLPVLLLFLFVRYRLRRKKKAGNANLPRPPAN